MLTPSSWRIATLWLLAGVLFATSSSGQSSIRQCLRIAVQGVADGGLPLSGKRLTVSNIVDLRFTVLMSVPPDVEHTLDLRLYLPGGHLYQSIAAPIAPPDTPDEDAAAGRRVPGYPHQVPATVAQSVVDNGVQVWAVDVTVPVAGTQISQSGLYGTWTVQAFLDGAKQPCAQAAKFTLVQ
jgi:hypothetical protein